MISQGISSNLNVFDFDFFIIVANHKRLNLITALTIAEIMTNISQNDFFFANSAVYILTIIIKRFIQDPNLHAFLSYYFKEALTVIE